MTAEMCSTTGTLGGGEARTPKMPTGKPTGPARPGRIMRFNGGLEMHKTKERRLRTERHSKRLAREVLRRAGTQEAVGRATNKSPGTIAHYQNDRPHPVLVEAFDILISLNGTPGVSAQAFAEAVNELVELSDIVTADDAVLIERALYLLRFEDEAGFHEDQAAMISEEAHAKELRVVASASAELASLLDELRYRNIEMHELRRARARAS